MILFLFGDRGRGEDFLTGIFGQGLGNSFLNHGFAHKSFTFCFCKTFTKSFHTTSGINKLLLAGKIRVTVGTNVHFDKGDSGTSYKFIPTCTLNCSDFVFWMYSCLHNELGIYQYFFKLANYFFCLLQLNRNVPFCVK